MTRILLLASVLSLTLGCPSSGDDDDTTAAADDDDDGRRSTCGAANTAGARSAGPTITLVLALLGVVGIVRRR